MTTTHIMSDETGQQILAQLTAISQALDDGALTNQQIATVLNDQTPTGAGFLDGGGLKTFFDGLKTKFAAIVHNHSGDALTPASITATGAISGSSVSDSVGSLAALRESVYLIDTKSYSVSANASATFTVSNRTSVILLVLGLWSHSCVALVFPNYEGNPTVVQLGRIGGGSGLSVFSITGNDTSITVTNTGAYSEPFSVIEFKKS